MVRCCQRRSGVQLEEGDLVDVNMADEWWGGIVVSARRCNA